MWKAQVVTEWAEEESPDGPVMSPRVAHGRTMRCRDITEQQNLPVDVNLLVVEIVCEEATMVEVEVDQDCQMLWSEEV